ncbi:phosphate ABC transporter substrate-binding protein [Alkalihalobacterium alkalinitrilicum]|uniref:phosphate ABC transporter substrate-binding protein n=1 Tax=Alkalihalobacterium alkalinitrilicum TaxID=427920 RepID=UPI0009959E6E|nr:phosphate ABC transporter substrate-binding protein [Alkalihalobacterium alkalinitrilicum]
MKFRGRILSVILGASIMTLAACGGGNASEPTTTDDGTTGGDNTEDTTPTEEVAELPSGALDIRGSDTMVNLGQALAETYMEYNELAGLSVTGGGSGTGIAAMINNNVDIAQSSRAMKDEELDEAEANGADAHEFIVAQDGLAVAIHNDNPVTEMTMQQVKDIFTGKTTDWSDLGWEEGGEISVYSRQSNSGTYVYFNENVMDGEDFGAGTKFMPGSSAIKEAIEQEVNAIGYIGIGYIDGINAANIALDENSEYVTPFEANNVNTGKYPIARPLYFYTNGVPEGLLLDYLKWVITSEDAHQVIYDVGFYQIGQYEDQNNQVIANLGLDF